MLDVLATPVGIALRTIHSVLSEVFLPGSGPAWALSIVLLTVMVRLLLFPLFVKQIRSQRRMQQIAPLVKEVQQRHKGDRETMNTEMMKLYKEHKANPIAGCLPLLLQLPVFFALFTVVREFKPGAEPAYGLSAQLLEEGGRAKVFGAPISAAFNSPASLLETLDGNVTVVRVVAAVMVLLMGGSTFITQKQMMARAGTGDPQQQQIQKLLLYFMPLSLVVSGFFFPIGVLLYWLTTNLWSMGQQAWVIKRMPMVPPGTMGTGSGPTGTAGVAPTRTSVGGPATSGPGAAAATPSGGSRKVSAGRADPVRSGAGGRVGGSRVSTGSRPPAARKKKGRPGGRH